MVKRNILADKDCDVGQQTATSRHSVAASNFLVDGHSAASAAVTNLASTRADLSIETAA